jgi:hypothetical protein
MSLTALIFLILAAGAAAVVWALAEGKLPSWAVVFLTLLVYGLVLALLPALVGG